MCWKYLDVIASKCYHIQNKKEFPDFKRSACRAKTQVYRGYHKEQGNRERAYIQDEYDLLRNPPYYGVS